MVPAASLPASKLVRSLINRVVFHRRISVESYWFSSSMVLAAGLYFREPSFFWLGKLRE